MGNWWTWLNSSFTACSSIQLVNLYLDFPLLNRHWNVCWFICFAPSETVACVNGFICVVIVESLATQCWSQCLDVVTRQGCKSLCNKDDWMCCSKMQVVFNKYTVLPQMSSCRGIFYNQCNQVFDISCLHQHPASWKQVPVHGVLSLIYRTHHSIIFYRFLFLTYVQHHSSVFFKQVCLLTLALEKPPWGFHVGIISGHFQWCELGSGFITFAAHWFGLGSLTGWLESGGGKGKGFVSILHRWWGPQWQPKNPPKNSSRGNHVHEIICGDRQLFVNNLLVLVHDISICSEDKIVGRTPHELYAVRLH